MVNYWHFMLKMAEKIYHKDTYLQETCKETEKYFLPIPPFPEIADVFIQPHYQVTERTTPGMGFFRSPVAGFPIKCLRWLGSLRYPFNNLFASASSAPIVQP